MATRRAETRNSLGQTLTRYATTVAIAVSSAVVSLAVLLSPLGLARLKPTAEGAGPAGDVDPYAPVSVLLATVALGVVLASLLLQRSQVRHERVWLQRELQFNIVKVAMDDPSYAQCWGPRVSPPDMDERLFYYLNLILMLWSYGWEHRQLSDDQLRTYADAFFETEVAREYWKRFGAWRTSGGHREKTFEAIMRDAYLRAVSSGPPSRPYEPPERNQMPSRIFDLDAHANMRTDPPWSTGFSRWRNRPRQGPL